MDFVSHRDYADLSAFIFSALVLKFPAVFWLSVSFIALFSLYGDRNELQPKVRLCAQFVAGIGWLFALFYWESRGWSTYVLIPVFSVFVVGTANYYNFMDGINGIAGVTGIVAFGLIVLFGFFEGSRWTYGDYRWFSKRGAIRPDDGGRRTEDRGQWTEDGRRRTEGRGHGVKRGTGIKNEWWNCEGVSCQAFNGI